MLNLMVLFLDRHEWLVRCYRATVEQRVTVRNPYRAETFAPLRFNLTW